MLKLTKYEFIKSKFTLIIIGLIFAILEGYFLYSIIVQDSEASIAASIMLISLALLCFFIVYIMAITNYSKELSSKSSYLIFMTPNSSLSIILSKMLNIFIVGLLLIFVFGVVGMIDLQLVFSTYDAPGDIIDFLKELFMVMEIDTAYILPVALVYILEFLISFYSVVTMIYFAITLSSTVLQNKSGKGIVSFILVIIFTVIMIKVEEILPLIYELPENAIEAIISILPTAIFEFFIMLGCVFGSAILLEKKVSL